MDAVTWEKAARADFEAVIARIPVFLKGIAEQKVSQKAEALARDSKRAEVSRKDVIDAFFDQTPFGFHGPLKMDMEALGIDYKKYGYS